jgi:hypothetical protein
MSTTIFRQTRLFARQRREYLDEPGFASLLDAIASNPSAGVLIPGSGGLRKLRLARPGSGKRGGLRVIYYIVHPRNLCVLITVFAKSAMSDLSADDYKRLKRLVQVTIEEVLDEATG